LFSPHCAGNIALLISGLKAKGEKWTPYSILRAIENSSKQFKNPNFLTHGRGLLQVKNAMKYLLDYPLDKTVEEPLFYSVKTDHGQRGIYLYNFEETHQKIFEEQISIQSVFSKKTPKEDLVKFEKRFHLKIKDDNENSNFIKFPSYVFLSNSGAKGISIKIDTTKFKENEVYYNEILGFDSLRHEREEEEEKQGPLFRIPITILKPMKIESDIHLKDVQFGPGQLQRTFIQ
jgi:tripeptidyl-peptidase II